MDNQAILSCVLTLLGGGLMGAMTTIAFTRHRSRIELSISLVSEFLRKDGEFAKARGLIEKASKKNNMSREDYNKIWATGDWFEVASYLAMKGLCNRGLFKSIGLTHQAKRFHFACQEASRNNPVIGQRVKEWSFLRAMIGE